MYKVENINETNTFVVKKDNSVKRCIRRYGDEEAYLPAGTLINAPCLRTKDITDEMLNNPKAKGARKHYYSLYTFPYTHTDRDILWSDEMPDIANAVPCQLRRATKEEVEQCKRYAEEFNGLVQKRLDEQARLNEERERERKAEEEKKQAALRKFKRSPMGIWATIVNKVSRKLVCELIILAGKVNKEHIRTSELLQDDYDIRFRLENDLFERLYGISRKEYERKFMEYTREGKDPYELVKKIFGNGCFHGSHCCSPLFLALHMYW